MNAETTAYLLQLVERDLMNLYESQRFADEHLEVPPELIGELEGRVAFAEQVRDKLRKDS